MSDQLSDRTIARHNRRRLARMMYGGFYRCPHTQRVLPALVGDDKVLCTCGWANPAVLQERTEETGVHIVRFLRAASVDDFLDQCEADDDARAHRG